MSSWARSARCRRRCLLSRGGAKPFRPFRSQPYPGLEEQKVLHHDTEGFENVARTEDYSVATDYKTSSHESNVKPTKDGDKRGALYRRFYQHFHGDGAKQPADCVILSLNNQKLDYVQLLGHCLEERGLMVEMLYLQSESGLTQALKDIRSDGSLLCILAEQTNVELSSCTVIIFSESLKIHRNMPREQALDLVMVEYGRASGARRQCDHAEASERASELSNDCLERAKLERHAVPSATRHLLLLMAEGFHLYPEELGSIAAYVHNRQDHLQATSDTADSKVAPEAVDSVPSGLGNPPPLLPTPVGAVPMLTEHPATSTDTSKPAHGQLMSASDSYPKTKPPPLLSLNILQGSPQGHPPHDPPLYGSTGSRAPSTSRGHPPPHGSPAFESRSLIYGPPPLHGPPVPNGPPRSHALCSPSPPHGPATPHSSSASHNPQPKSSPAVLKGPPESHAVHLPRSHNGPHIGFHIRGPPPPRGPLLQNGPSGLRAPPPLLRNLRLKNPAGLSKD